MTACGGHANGRSWHDRCGRCRRWHERRNDGGHGEGGDSELERRKSATCGRRDDRRSARPWTNRETKRRQIVSRYASRDDGEWQRGVSRREGAQEARLTGQCRNPRPQRNAESRVRHWRRKDWRTEGRGAQGRRKFRRYSENQAIEQLRPNSSRPSAGTVRRQIEESRPQKGRRA